MAPARATFGVDEDVATFKPFVMLGVARFSNSVKSAIFFERVGPTKGILVWVIYGASVKP